MKKQKTKLTKTTPKRTRRNLKLLKRSYSHLRILPVIIVTLVASLVLTAQQLPPALNPINAVLAKATNTSITGLLDSTNNRRTAAGVGRLTLNSKLNSAAQAKANDMVKDKYWAHVAPDGTQPWAFFDSAGYQYLSAGENLAYGFLTSNSTVTGWMNSPSHKANMLNGTFTDVGFGIANTDHYIYDGVDHGPQTIVVAHYGKPKVASATTKPKTSTPKKSTNSGSTQSSTKKKTDTTAKTADKPKDSEQPAEEQAEDEVIIQPEEIALLENDDSLVAASAEVTRIQLWTDGNAIWSASFVSMAVLAVIGLWGIHKGIHIHRWIVAGENFIAHHVYLDLIVLGFILTGFALLASSGAIK